MTNKCVCMIALQSITFAIGVKKLDTNIKNFNENSVKKTDSLINQSLTYM